MTGAKTRVLVVDDSALVRNQVVSWLAEDRAIEIVGTAANGRQGVDKHEDLKPDVVILDVEMPLMDGLQVVEELRKRGSKAAIIMFSTLTGRGGSTTLEALARGATDYVLKPSSMSQGGITTDATRAELLAKVNGLRERSAPQPPARSPLRTRPPLTRIDAIAIGTSTGGPNVLETIFRELPASLPVPVLVTQHMPPVFTGILAERLTRLGGLKVREGAPNMVVSPGEAYIAPGGHHMVLERRGADLAIQLNDDPPENGCRPAVDVMFRSVAEHYGPNALAVILTGMGKDGLKGIEAMHARGAHVLAQDEASSVVWSMPGHVARAGLADQVLSPLDIAREMRMRAVVGRAVARAT